MALASTSILSKVMAKCVGADDRGCQQKVANEKPLERVKTTSTVQTMLQVRRGNTQRRYDRSVPSGKYPVAFARTAAA
jgi:hypothetical protein